MNSDANELIILVRQAQAGDIAAFNQLIFRFQDRAVGYAFRLLHNRLDAEDAAQDAFVQFWLDLPRLRNPQVAEVYLRRMIFKYCDRLKRTVTAPTVSLNDIAIATVGDEPFAVLLRREQRQSVARALFTLPLSQQRIARLRYECDLSLAEIAAHVGLPNGTIKNRLHAARKRLRKELWEMADEILTEQKPSESGRFTSDVLARIMTDFERQMRADPHLANRALLTEARSGLDLLLKADTPPDFMTARYGFDLLLRQDDWKSAAALLLRFLDGSHPDSETAWAYLHLANTLALSDQPGGAVLAHQAFERWIPGREPRLSPQWPYLPVDDEGMPACGRDDCRLLFLGQSYEFASAYLATGRLQTYLQQVDERLQHAPQSGPVAELRFYALRMAIGVCLTNKDSEWARDYIEQIYRAVETITDAKEKAHKLLRAYGDHLTVLRNTKDTQGFNFKARETHDLLNQLTAEGYGSETWLRGERHNFAHQFSELGLYADALPLWEANAQTGRQLNGWGYLLHAEANWHETADRVRTLSLLRDAAAHDDRDLTEMFQERPGFADVRYDSEFLTAVKKPA